MDVTDLIRKNRSYRRFDESAEISRDTLRDLVDLARQTPSAANKLPLKYILCSTPERNEAVFATLGWAAYLSEWPGPDPGERPSAYIVVLGDTRIAAGWSVDPGIAMQSMLLAAVDRGLGGCMFGSIKRRQLADALDIPEHLHILYVLALGRPIEVVRIEDVEPGGDIRYYRDDEAVHHVPKRGLDEIIVG